VRKVLDLADDWTRLIPHRRGTIASLYRRISAEADEIIVAAPELTGVLGGRPAVVVRNAASAEALAEPVRPAPGRRRMAYVGTLSERFDTSLVTGVLAGLPGWTLSLYGPCRYQGHGDRPDRELGALLHARASQVRWHGPVSRRDAVRVLDAADVLILPNNTALSVGQDPMKLYDYAARGRPIVSTTLPGPDAPRPPFLYERDTADSFAVAILAAADEPPDRVAGRRRWAESNSWSARLPLWLAAARGCPQTGESPGNGAATCTW
jgi:glycosyltransferase involved in cell wall biosynthesis